MILIFWLLAFLTAIMGLIFFNFSTTIIGNIWGIGNWIAMFISVNISFLIGAFIIKFIKEK